MKSKAGKTKPLTAAELILKQQAELERRIFLLCQRFEARTGMSVMRIGYPGDRDSDYGRGAATDRVMVMIAPPCPKKESAAAR